MIDIVSATVPIFLVVGIGYLTTRGGLFNVSGRDASEIFHASYLLTYAGSALFVMGVAGTNKASSASRSSSS